MNWYKKALLIDKRGPGDMNRISVLCSYCGRWATHPNNERVEKRNYVWKRPEQMDSEEKYEADLSLRNLSVSHGICPYCVSILKESLDMPVEDVRERSLEREELSVI